MNKKILSFVLIFLLILQIITISAISSGQAKQNWVNSKQTTLNAQESYRNAHARYVGSPNEQNLQLKLSATKNTLNSVLDEVEAWLIWKEEEANENIDNVPEELINQIKTDIQINKAKIESLRVEVNAISSEPEANLVLLKMVLKYTELLTDVARNTGKLVVFRANEIIETTEKYEQSLRSEAQNFQNNVEKFFFISKLNLAKASIAEAKQNVNKAEQSYELVIIGAKPLVKFHEGNQYLRTARANMISANQELKNALELMS